MAAAGGVQRFVPLLQRSDDNALAVVNRRPRLGAPVLGAPPAALRPQDGVDVVVEGQGAGAFMG